MNSHAHDTNTADRILPIADLHNRFGAFIIDWHIRTIPVALWGFWLMADWFPAYWALGRRGVPPLEGAWQALQPVLDKPGVATVFWLCMVAYLLYHPVIELLRHGDSPGKRMMGIMVVSIDGSRPTGKQVLVRNLWRVIEFLPFAWLLGLWTMWRSPENARIGDARANTRVVLRS